MVKMIVVFLVITAVLHIAIEGWRYASGKERWKVAKTLTYSLGLGIISVVVLTTIVILF